MMRKIGNSCKHHGQPIDEFTPLLEALIERYIASGLLNDATYAQAKTATLRRQGRSKQAIHAKLQSKGLSKPEIDSALDLTDEDAEAELRAALSLAKKKKLGVFRPYALNDPKDLQKEMAVLGRAGFSYDIARKALSYQEDEAF